MYPDMSVYKGLTQFLLPSSNSKISKALCIDSTDIESKTFSKSDDTNHPEMFYNVVS